MANVKKAMGGGMVPKEVMFPGMTGNVKLPPDTIRGEIETASGKAKMNFKHPPLGPEQWYEDSENNRDPAEVEDKEDVQGGKMGVKGGKAKMSGKGGAKHRSTSGVPGHTLTGV